MGNRYCPFFLDRFFSVTMAVAIWRTGVGIRVIDSISVIKKRHLALIVRGLELNLFK